MQDFEPPTIRYTRMETLCREARQHRSEFVRASISGIWSKAWGGLPRPGARPAPEPRRLPPAMIPAWRHRLSLLLHRPASDR